MRIDTESFLAITALLAATAAPACSSDTNSGTGTDGGTGATSSGGKGAGGGKATGGSSGAGGSSGSGGAGGTVSTGGKSSGGTSAGKDGGADSAPEGGDSSSAACLGDTVLVSDAGKPDAATEGVDPCNLLPSAVDGCHSDAGGEGLAPAYAVCSNLEFTARPGIFAAVLGCLSKTPGITDPCSSAATAHALSCYDDTVARACPVAFPDGGAPNPCTAFVKACTKVTAAACEGALRSFTDESVGDFTSCLASATPVGDAGIEGGGDCGTAFWSCALPGITR